VVKAAEDVTPGPTSFLIQGRRRSTARRDGVRHSRNLVTLPWAVWGAARPMFTAAGAVGDGQAAVSLALKSSRPASPWAAIDSHQRRPWQGLRQRVALACKGCRRAPRRKPPAPKIGAKDNAVKVKMTPPGQRADDAQSGQRLGHGEARRP